MPRSLSQMPLHDKAKEATQLARDLADHLERGFLPKIRELKKLVESESGQQAGSDLTVRNAVSRIIESDEYSQQLGEKTAAYLKSMLSDLRGVKE